MTKFRIILSTSALFLAMGLPWLSAQGPAGSARAIASADNAWSRGDYPSALAEYIRILNAADGADYQDRIALQTGELYQSFELTADGRNPRFSPDGRLIAYETGLEASRRTHVVRADASLSEVADLPGISATFSPSSPEVAYLKVADTAEIKEAAAAVEAAALTASNRGTLVQTLAWHILRNTAIVVHNLSTKAEREIPAPGLLKGGLVFSADGRRLFFTGRPELDEEGNFIYGVAAAGNGQPSVLPGEGRFKTAPLVEPSGRFLLYTITAADLLRRPPFVPAQPGLSPQAAPAGRGGQGQAGPSGFVIVNLETGTATLRPGTAPIISGDGNTLAYVARNGTDYELMLGTTSGPASPIKKGTQRLDAPALSADGSRIAYQAMVRDDWELFTAGRDGRDEQRLTRDPQHDLLPQFVAGNRVLEVIGEPRHRRSFLLDPTTGGQTRLFHNNTVRTIAPEYQWVISRDGTRILIGAERDGNTVSPERGVYLIDLNRKVSKADLQKRLEANLASERTLRANQTKAFAPIAKDVRSAVDDVAVDRVYGYEKALFQFDSKHISQPGNKLAVDYLFATYESFGYAPERQTFSPQAAAGGQTANVIARLPGTVNPELVYVVSSHFDSVAAGPGADDDSSGTAALLEAARVLATRPQPATIIFASFTGEEAGLLGSREFVRRAVAGKLQVVGALNNDMIGWANDAHLDNTIRYSNPGIRDIQHGAAILFSRLITYDALYFKGTDAASYYDAYGDIVGGIGSHPVLSSPHYHQPHDLLEFENHEQIAETSKTTVATIMRLASSPSRIKGLKLDSYAGGVAVVSWEASPEKGIASYAVSVTPPAGADSASARHLTVTKPGATLRNVVPGSIVGVKAINARGLDGWDAARLTVSSR